MKRRIPWPDGIQCPVVLNFHMDAESLLIATDPENVTRPITLSQGTYGPRMGVPRILGLLEKYGIKGCFYIPGISAERHPYAVEAINAAARHEIGVHGYTHTRPDALSPQDEEAELARGIEVLQKMTGRKIRGYISAAWEYSPSTVRILRKLGIEYASDFMDEDIPYYLQVDGQSSDFVALPVSWTLDDAPLYWFGLLPPVDYGGPYTEPSRAFELWSSEFDALYDEGAYFHLTMHPFLTGRACRIKTLERLIQHIMQRPGVKFCTCAEVVDMYRSVVSQEQGKPGAWFPAESSPEPQFVVVDGAPMTFSELGGEKP
jgi:peptidoglycan/xylan/chitin deacetylase (PgdA/CDA1 family)